MTASKGSWRRARPDWTISLRVPIRLKFRRHSSVTRVMRRLRYGLFFSRQAYRVSTEEGISASGNVFPKAATAGSVCTISPIELRRITKNFCGCSDMRAAILELRRRVFKAVANIDQILTRRMTFRVSHNAHRPPQTFNDFCFRHGGFRIIGSFTLDVGFQIAQNLFGCEAIKDGHKVHAFESRD